MSADDDEYCKGAFDITENNGGLQVAQVYQELNNMKVTQLEDVKEEDAYLYGVPWTTRYTIEPTAESIAKIDVGSMENDKGVEISMARIYGWGHWNYYPDAKLMWQFMSKYARNLETGETIRLDKQEQTQPSEDVNNKGEIKPSTSVATGDQTQILSFVIFGIVSLIGVISLYRKKKESRH